MHMVRSIFSQIKGGNICINNASKRWEVQLGKRLGLDHKRFGVDSSRLVIEFKGMSVVEMAKTVLCWNVFEDGNWEQMYEQK